MPAAVVYLLMSDRSALITALILDRQMCLPCIASKAMVTEARVQSALEAIATALVLHHDTGRCIACGETTVVHSVLRPTS